MMAQPPAFSTEAATASESVATTTSPTAAARARRRTCTIIGSPAMSASGLPGSLVAAIRAGMTIKTSLAAIDPQIGLKGGLGKVANPRKSVGGLVAIGGYTGCQG